MPCDEAEAQAAAGLGAGGIEAHEALGDAGAVAGLDARTAVAHRDGRRPVGGGQLQGDVGTVASGVDAVFEGVVDEVRNGLGEQLAVGTDGDGLRGLHDEDAAALLGKRCEELADLLDEALQLDGAQALAHLTRLGAGDGEERIESGEKGIGLADGDLERRAVVAAGGALSRFETGAQTRQGRAQVVGDVARDLLHAGHEALDLVEHLVQADGQPVELVARAGNGNALRQVARHDGAAGGGDGLDAAQEIAAHQHAAEEAENDGDGEREIE